MRRTSGTQYEPAKQVKKITLTEKSVSKRRIFFIALFFCVGIGAFVYAFTHLGSNKKGWQTVALDRTNEDSCSVDFTFTYEFGTGKGGINKEYSAVRELYEKLTTDGYRLFDRSAEYDGVVNVRSINRHPNETLTVSEALYRALAVFEKSNSRDIYLGALAEHYEALIGADSAEALAETDPYTSEEVREFFGKVASFALDPASVRLELLDGNRVILHVSEEYLTYASSNDIENFIDFGWTKNAFLADYIADGFLAKGYNHGVIASFDGFVRNFAESEEEFSYPLYMRVGNTVYTAASVAYRGNKSIVSLRSYPVDTLDQFRYLLMADGSIRNCYVDEDGLSKAACAELTGWSDGLSCAETAVAMVEYYIADTWNRAVAADGLRGKGVFTVTHDDYVIHCNDTSAVIGKLYDRDGVRFTVSQ